MLANRQALDDCGVYTDLSDNNDHTPMLIYSFYGDLSSKSLQILMELTPGISKFGRSYRPSYVFSSHFKRLMNV